MIYRDRSSWSCDSGVSPGVSAKSQHDECCRCNILLGEFGIFWTRLGCVKRAKDFSQDLTCRLMPARTEQVGHSWCSGKPHNSIHIHNLASHLTRNLHVQLTGASYECKLRVQLPSAASECSLRVQLLYCDHTKG